MWVMHSRTRGLGFTLVELMLVITVIGILTAISIPNIIRFQCRAKQTESKEVLKSMYMTQLVYEGEFGSYLNLSQLTTFGGLAPSVVNGRYYGYTIIGGSSFTATASDVLVRVQFGSASNDAWIVSDTDPRPLNVVDACM
jgi:type IV pilus assembly protein PilA